MLKYLTGKTVQRDNLLLTYIILYAISSPYYYPIQRKSRRARRTSAKFKQPWSASGRLKITKAKHKLQQHARGERQRASTMTHIILCTSSGDGVGPDSVVCRTAAVQSDRCRRRGSPVCYCIATLISEQSVIESVIVWQTRDFVFEFPNDGRSQHVASLLLHIFSSKIVRVFSTRRIYSRTPRPEIDHWYYIVYTHI